MKLALTEIYESAIKLVAPLGEEETYSTIVSEGQRLAGASYGSIFLWMHDRLVRVYSSVPVHLQIEPRRNGFTYQAFAEKKAMVVNINRINQVHPEFNDHNTKKMIFIPLSFNGQAIGVVTLDSMQTGTFSNKRLQTLHVFGTLASLKLRNQFLLAETKSALETRDLFISMASHELKTPLTTISAYAQLINKHMLQGKEIDPKWAETLSVAALKMSRLVNELLHVNQIRTGQMVYKKEPTLVGDIVQKAVTDFASSYREHMLHVEMSLKVKQSYIEVDGDKIGQVLINLLNNAGKFSPPDQPILLQVRIEKKQITFSVIDHGPGISQEHLQHLFEEFYKANANSKEGLGLGLFISKKILEAHRGIITVESQLGLGTTVSATVPVKRYEKS